MKASTVRRALFQIHLWCGLIAGLYILVISITGSVLVYRNELRARYDPKPRAVEVAGERLSAEALITAARTAFPGWTASVDFVPEEASHAVTLLLERGSSNRLIFFDPYTGEALGNALPLGWRLTTWMLDLHDNLLSGQTGRRVNGAGAIALTLLAATGLVIWWPGKSRLRGSLLLDWKAGWKRFNWSLHSTLGIWAVAFVLLWGVTGIYLCFPEPFTRLVDRIEPVDLDSFEPRVGDRVLYWLGYLHFGRFGGTPTKLLWATLGAVPPLLFLSGALMWWNRVLRPRLMRRRSARS